MEAQPTIPIQGFSIPQLLETIPGGGSQNSSPRFLCNLEDSLMKPTSGPPLDRFHPRLSEMAALHLQATHLPYVRQYHSRSQRASSRGKTLQDLGKPKKRWTLPLYLTDLSQLDSLADATTCQGGWLYFLDWGHGLLGTAEIQKLGRKPALVSLSIGSAATPQHAVLERFFQSKVRYQHLRCIAVPSLHFRGLSYLNPTTGKVVIMPMYSAIAPLQRGRRYSCETIQERLKAALDHRLTCAREHQERLRISDRSNITSSQRVE
jgi:hypothetical protein